MRTYRKLLRRSRGTAQPIFPVSRASRPSETVSTFLCESSRGWAWTSALPEMLFWDPKQYSALLGSHSDGITDVHRDLNSKIRKALYGTWSMLFPVDLMQIWIQFLQKRKKDCNINISGLLMQFCSFSTRLLYYNWILTNHTRIISLVTTLNRLKSFSYLLYSEYQIISHRITRWWSFTLERSDPCDCQNSSFGIQSRRI